MLLAEDPEAREEGVRGDGGIVSIPNLTDHFKVWFGERTNATMKVKSTYINYVRAIKKFIESEQGNLGATNINLNKDLLNFGAGAIVLLPFPHRHREELGAPSAKKTFHQAYLQLVECMEEFFFANFLNVVGNVRYSKVCFAAFWYLALSVYTYLFPVLLYTQI